MVSLETQWKRAGKRWSEHETEREKRMDELEKIGTAAAATVDWTVIDSKARLQNRMNGMGLYEKAEKLADENVIEPEVFERILNEDQLADIVFFERGLVAARSVGRVVIFSSPSQREGFGSGVMVSPRLFMTNNHVLESEAMAEHSMVEFGYLTSIGGMREARPFKLMPQEFFFTDPTLDFTMVAVAPTNDAGVSLRSRGHCPLLPATGKAVAGQRVNIIQHPRGERMQVSVRENRILDIPGDFLHYETDTEPGSSGSPVFNDQWEMAALHHSGVPNRNDRGEILLKSGKVWRNNSDNAEIDWVANEGARISRIVEHLENREMTALQRRLFDQTKRPSDPMDLWDLMEGIAGAGVINPTELAGIPTGMTGPIPDAQGHPSWLFRLRFGPEGTV